MHELAVPSCDAIRPLFAEMTASRSVVFAPLEGNNPGHVFVDDPDEPRSACVAMGDTSYTGDVFFGGFAGNDTLNADVRALLTEEVMPSLVANGDEGHMMNEASGAVARKLGFVQQPDLEVNYVRVTR